MQNSSAEFALRTCDSSQGIYLERLRREVSRLPKVVPSIELLPPHIITAECPRSIVIKRNVRVSASTRNTAVSVTGSRLPQRFYIPPTVPIKMCNVQSETTGAWIETECHIGIGTWSIDGIAVHSKVIGGRVEITAGGVKTLRCQSRCIGNIEGPSEKENQ